jgi:hypothetical protein
MKSYKLLIVIIFLIIPILSQAKNRTELLEDLALSMVYINLLPHIAPCSKAVDEKGLAGLVRTESCKIIVAENNLAAYVETYHKELRLKLEKHWSLEQLKQFDETLKEMTTFRKKIKKIVEDHMQYLPAPGQQAV